MTYYKCPDCDAIVEDVEPLYECGNCGEIFTKSNSANYNHQCPSCNKFASKLSNNGCPECGTGDCEEVDAKECQVCGEVVEDLEAHVAEQHPTDDDEDGMPEGTEPDGPMDDEMTKVVKTAKFEMGGTTRFVLPDDTVIDVKIDHGMLRVSAPMGGRLVLMPDVSNVIYIKVENI